VCVAGGVRCERECGASGQPSRLADRLLTDWELSCRRQHRPAAHNGESISFHLALYTSFSVFIFRVWSFCHLSRRSHSYNVTDVLFCLSVIREQQDRANRPTLTGDRFRVDEAYKFLEDNK